MRQSLKTHDNVRQWDVGASTDLNLLRCSLCESQPDSHDHLFFECPFSSQVWLYVRRLAGTDLIPPRLQDIVAWPHPMAHQRTTITVIGRLLFAATSYYIWIERNNRLFKNSRRSPEDLRDIIMFNVHLKLHTFKFKNTTMVKHLLTLWKMPKTFRLYGC